MMEMSSPLAAMRPSVPAFGRRDIFAPQYHDASPFAPSLLSAGAVSLRDPFSFQRPKADYFSVKPVRGSSPTASLAADLSQNFNINESSPLFPTPRRALFTTAAMMDAVETRGYATTPPPLASSSPAPGNMMDVMDLSPLPHKAPFSVAHVAMQSPTPVQSPDGDDGDVMMESSPAASTPVGSRQSSLEPGRPIVADRKLAGLRRPSLSRAKGYSTGGVAGRLQAAENHLPPFRFGAGSFGTSMDPVSSRRSSASSMSSAMSLSECFEESPQPERRPSSANSPCPPAIAAARTKPHFASLTNLNAVRNGSPINSHLRRPSNPLLRPRKQFRRSLSMFEDPREIIKTKQEGPPGPSNLQSVMDVEEPHELVLPHFFPGGQSDSIPRITRGTMLDVLDGKFVDRYDQKMVIDCRFEYEYDGGHIDGAVNYNDKELLASQLFEAPTDGRVLIIFHCEYSAHRAPIMARHIRSQDRTANAENYPRLTYPEVYILEGGYSGFFTEHRDRCYPQAYVEMGAAEHVNTCERKMGQLRQHRKGLNRAQTFAFGQGNHMRGQAVHDSPTAPSRKSERESSSTDSSMLGVSPVPVFGGDRGHARRMVSF